MIELFFLSRAHFTSVIISSTAVPTPPTTMLMATATSKWQINEKLVATTLSQMHCTRSDSFYSFICLVFFIFRARIFLIGVELFVVIVVDISKGIVTNQNHLEMYTSLSNSLNANVLQWCKRRKYFKRKLEIEKLKKMFFFLLSFKFCFIFISSYLTFHIKMTCSHTMLLYGETLTNKILEIQSP